MARADARTAAANLRSDPDFAELTFAGRMKGRFGMWPAGPFPEPARIMLAAVDLFETRAIPS